MAQKATVYKVDLDISDMDRSYYQSHHLTLALHPSETESRMMLRVLAFALNAQEALQFTRGLSADDEPDIWLKDLTGAIDLWIEVGLPDERRLRKACGRAKQVLVYAYGDRAVSVWWSKSAREFARLDNLRVFSIDDASLAALTALAGRGIHLSISIQDGDISISNGTDNVPVTVRSLQPD
jgi:uncharacterized protein YaeQ